MYLGNGDGTFIMVASHSTAQYPRWLAVADFDMDSNADMITANESSGAGGSASVLLGKGDGTFVSSPTVKVDTLQSYVGAAEDFDDDGNVDLAISSWGLSNALNGILSILKGNGDGTFDLLSTYGIGKQAEDVVASDFDGDQIPDLALVHGRSHNIHVFRGIGDGTFELLDTYPVDPNPTSLVSGNFNEDALVDLVSSNWNGNNVSVLLNNANGTFGSPTSFTTEEGPRDIVVHDIDHDGSLDLVVLSSKLEANVNAISVLMGIGDGDFQEAVVFDIVGAFAWALSGGDFDEDGELDLVVTDLDSDAVYLFEGFGDGTFDIGFKVGSVANPRAVITGDYDADGHEDIIVTSADDNNLTLFLGTGNGTFNLSEPFLGAEEAWEIIPGDLNHDGYLDLAITSGIFGSDHVSIFLNTADTTTDISRGDTKRRLESVVLNPNYPNPVNAHTTISYGLPRSSYVTLKIYNILGQEVATLVNEEKNSGYHRASWYAGNIASGVYFFRLSVTPTAPRDPVSAAWNGRAGEFVDTKKILLLK
jgi:hypothetical protein